MVFKASFAKVIPASYPKADPTSSVHVIPRWRSLFRLDMHDLKGALMRVIFFTYFFEACFKGILIDSEIFEFII